MHSLSSESLACALLLFADCTKASAVFGRQASSQITNGTIVSDDYFAGQSPPVYPSPAGTGTSGWEDAYKKAAALVAKLTLEEKVNLTSGFTDTSNGCAGNIAPITRVGFPGLCLHDASNGVRGSDLVNGYPAGLHAGAAWNRELAYQRAHHMGKEFKAKGINVLLGPTIGPLGRVVRGGRNWESFSNDPYLSGQLVAETVRGSQEVGVITSTKHFIANEQETNRVPSTNANGTAIESSSSNLDDKTLHELYLWPFADALKAGTGNIMCSYNRINNSYGCQNSKTLNGILKTELGFQGFVVSDWNAQHSGVSSALAGLDMAMPIPYEFWGSALGKSVINGSVPVSRLDDMATRILATWYQFGQDKDFPERGVGMPADMSLPHKKVNARDPASKATLLQSAVEGHVLVKNTNKSLPLKSPKMLSVFGYDAKTPDAVDIGAGSLSTWLLGFEILDVNLQDIVPLLTGAQTSSPPSQIAPNGTLICGGGSASITPPYWNSPFAALEQRAYKDDTALFWDFTTVNSTAAVDPASDACLVFINAWSSEGYDRTGVHDDFSDVLVLNIAAQCANTIVVIHNAGIRLVSQFSDHPNVTAIIFAHLPGQDSGRALVSLLYGDENFSGKLPYTVAKNESDYGALYAPAQPEGLFKLYPQSNYSENIYIDYRAFDKQSLQPQYEFGFGLSYTTFAVSNLSIAMSKPSNAGLYATGPIAQGGQIDLWDTIATVSATVRNTGDVEGQEVVQLYIGIPNAPVRQLRGFEKVRLGKGASATVRMTVTRRDLSVWNTTAQKWEMQRGTYQVFVGNSSRSLPLTGQLIL